MFGRPRNGALAWALGFCVSYAGAAQAATDLHTHWVGAFPAPTLVEAAVEAGLPISSDYLREAGLPDGPSSFASLTSGQREALVEAMRIAKGAVADFEQFERIYRLRDRIASDPALIGKLLSALARDYRKQGVEYVEISYGDIRDPKVFSVFERSLPRIEKETGVKIRLLLSIRRQKAGEMTEQDFRSLAHLMGSPWVAGVDFLGEENNPVQEFSETIRRFARFKNEVRPDFQIKVHAGENDLFPGNMKEALAAGATRIGHGVYGADEEAIELARRKGAILEANQTSNLRLGHVESAEQVPIRQYLEKGVRVTLGTDGHGVFQTTKAEEADLARSAGVSDELVAGIARSDAEYVSAVQGSLKKMSGSCPALFHLLLSDPRF